MVVQLRPRAITVERGSRGFGLSLIYRGLDKYEEKDTGIFVARVVPGGQAARYGVRENDKILTINQKTPRNVDDAVGVIKQAGNQIKLVVLREEDVPAGQPDISIDPADDASLQSGEIDSKWVSLKLWWLINLPTYIFLKYYTFKAYYHSTKSSSLFAHFPAFKKRMPSTYVTPALKKIWIGPRSQLTSIIVL